MFLKGAWPLIAGLMCLLFAGYSFMSGSSHPALYHPLAEFDGTVVSVIHGRGNRVFVTVDQPVRGREPLQDPDLTGASVILAQLATGMRVSGKYDPWTEKIWELDQSEDHRGYGNENLAQWQAEDRAAGRNRGRIWAVIGGLILLSGIALMVRE